MMRSLLDFVAHFCHFLHFVNLDLTFKYLFSLPFGEYLPEISLHIFDIFCHKLVEIFEET